MRVLITGGTGFIGSAAARCLYDHGHEIAVLTREERSLEGIECIHGNLADPPWKAIAGFRPETCLHAAWVTEPGVYLEAPVNRDWLEWSRSFFEGLASKTDVAKIIGLGTCIEYTASDEPFLGEDSPTGGNPWLYAKCKDELRRFLQNKAPEWQVGWAWGRVFYPYGPGEDPGRLGSSLIEKLQAGEALELKTPDSTKDYIFIDDLAEAIRLVTEATEFEGCVNLGTGIGVTVRQLGLEIARILDQQESLVRNAEILADDPLARVVADVSRLEKLGMSWRHSLESGLREMVAQAGQRP